MVAPTLDLLGPIRAKMARLLQAPICHVEFLLEIYREAIWLIDGGEINKRVEIKAEFRNTWG